MNSTVRSGESPVHTLCMLLIVFQLHLSTPSIWLAKSSDPQYTFWSKVQTARPLCWVLRDRRDPNPNAGLKLPLSLKSKCQQDTRTCLHVRFVVVANLLDPDVVLGLDEGLGGGVGPSQRHHAGDVLEVFLVLHFDLGQEERAPC